MIRVSDHDDIRVLWLERGRGNALSPAFLAALLEAVEESRREEPRGLVLTAEGSIFSAGLDLGEMLELDRQGMRGALHLLHSLCLELFRFPRPVVAALNGHAIAGGAFLSLACDLRFMAQGEGRWGLSEASLALSSPPSLIEMARYSLQRPVIEKLLYGGAVYPAFKALDMGVLDELVELEKLLDESYEAVRQWTPSIAAFADIKARLKAPAVAAMEKAHPEDGEAWLDMWFGDEAQGRLTSARDRLVGKRGASR